MTTAGASAALLGGATGPIRLTGSMDAGAQATVADELLGTWETMNISDGGQQDHCTQEADPRQLHEKGYLARPGFDGTQATKLRFHLGDGALEMVEQFQILASPQFFTGG